jgi:hypothetical protein
MFTPGIQVVFKAIAPGFEGLRKKEAGKSFPAPFT